MKSIVSVCAALSLSLTAGAGIATAQKGGPGGGGGNQTTAVLLSAVPLLSAAVGSSTVLTLTLGNEGSAPLTIAAFTTSGAAAADYRLGGTCANGAVLPRNPPANTCTVQITFAPTVLGRRNAVLNATFVNAPALSVPLNGDGLAPGPVFVLGLAQNSIDFGSKAVGAPPAAGLSDTTVTITNPGGKTLTGAMALIGADPGDFAFGSAGARTFNCPANLAPGPPPSVTSCQLGLDFIATTTGVRTATLRFTTNDPANQVVDVALSGIGTPGVVQPPPPITSAADFSDLWGNAAEPAWSLGITHHKATTDVLVAFWHTYDANGSDVWFELKDGHWVDGLTYTGNLHQPLGPPFSTAYNPALAVDVIVGTATLSFTDAANATFTYNVNGIAGSKAITRSPF